MLRSSPSDVALQAVLDLGVENDADLACIFTAERDMFDISADAHVVRCVTHAWKVAGIQLQVKLDMPEKRARRAPKDEVQAACPIAS